MMLWNLKKFLDVLSNGGGKGTSCAAESDEPNISADSTVVKRKTISKGISRKREKSARVEFDRLDC